jgi:hypothetical protein
VYCNYCRALNPDDSVYCGTCGRTIELLSEQFQNEAGESGPGDASDVVAAENLDSARVAEPHIDEKVQRDYAGMDDEELGQLQEAYEKLSVPLPWDLQNELDLRAIIKGVEDGLETGKQDHSAYNMESPPPSKPQLGLNAKAKEERARGGALRNWLQHGWDRLVSWGSMNRRQWACILFGFVLLVLSLLFVPTRWRGPYNPVSYSFLFTGQGSIDFGRLFVEWILVALVVSGLFFSQSKPRTLTPPSEDEPLAANRSGKLWQRKLVIPIVVALAVLTIGTAYYGSRRIARNLPPTEVSKLAGGASITNYGRFEWYAYNGSDFVLTEARVSISVFDEKGNALISNRVYRVPAYEFYPQQPKELSTDVGFTLGQGQTFQWSVVGAKGRPE